MPPCASATEDFPAWPEHADDEIEAAAGVLRSGRTNQWTGPEVGGFERAFSEWIGVRHTLAVSNGSVALELCLRALDVGPGDDVLVPARSYVATALAPGLVGANAKLIDAEAPSGNVTVDTLERVRTPQTRAAIVTHVLGWPCDMPAIMEWAGQHGILVVEDCAQAQGGRIEGRLVGGFGHVSAFSFSQEKIMSLGGEGGAVCTNDVAAFDRGWSWREHGKANFKVSVDRPSMRMGSNHRMTGMQAAIGLEQLRKVDGWSRTRAANAATLASALARCDGFSIPLPQEDRTHAAFMLAGIVESGDRAGLLASLVPRFPVRSGDALDVATSAPWCAAARHRSTPVADRIAAQGILLPVHPTATSLDMQRLAAAVTESLSRLP